MRKTDIKTGDILYLRKPPRLIKVEVLMVAKQILVCGINTRKRYTLKSAASLVHPLVYVITDSDLIN